MALAAGRSPTSLSDTAVGSQDRVGTRRRDLSLSRRRKISVPELGATMTTVQEYSTDSPTIPGHFPLRKQASEIWSHERSSSAPGMNWRACPFGDALISGVTGPATMPVAESVHKVDSAVSLHTTRPLSPIPSPSTTASKPILKLDTDMKVLPSPDAVPPEVPPKSPNSALNRGNRSGRPALTPASSSSNIRSPGESVEPKGSVGSPDKQGSPRSHSRNRSDGSVMDRGRPVKRYQKRSRSQTCPDERPAGENAAWKLPKGLRPKEAVLKLHVSEKEALRDQAKKQVEKFEVLSSKEVNSLSRELRALDERCEYLRNTYKSLRDGRQKLHARMVTYLKRNESRIFSRESLLKQEEALLELDKSIDDWILKLEEAENRRLRVRQKLLEHLAAAMTLIPGNADPLELAASTPPRSPVKSESPSRKDVESIKIYADGQVLNLFSDIEQAIGELCEGGN